MISAYLIDTVSIKRLTSRDQWQEPTWTSETLRARVEWQNKLIRNDKGEQVVSGALVYMSGDITAPTNADRIVIDSIEHAIMRVDKKTDFSTSHFEVWIQ
jgi:hypothetical protein